jgi:hypothetical protein
MPQMLPQPVFAPSLPVDRPWAHGLLASLEPIRTEVRRVHRRAYAAWPEPHAYLGDWLLMPLFSGSVTSAGACNCPRTTQLLKSLGARRAAIFRMEPGCHVLAHRRALPAQGIQVEFGLAVPRGTFFRSEGLWQQRPEGRLVVRTEVEEPETVHYGREPRLVLVADFAD